MPSTAAADWYGPRHARLAVLTQTADAAAAGSIEEEQADWALVVQTAAQFQAYCRDLHDLVVDELMTNTAGETAGAENVLRGALRSRTLAVGNATPEKIAEDFANLGLLKIWTRMKSSYPTTEESIVGLRLLLKLRNAIAHGDTSAVPALLGGKNIRVFASEALPKLDYLVNALDDITSAYVATLLQLGKPW